MDSAIKTELAKVAASLSSLNDTFGNFGSVDFDSIVPTQKIVDVRSSFQAARVILEAEGSFGDQIRALDDIVLSLDGLNGKLYSID